MAITGINVIPTYIYARIYKNGNILHAHKDRESCEISATIKLDESKNYRWPISIEGNYIELDIGDAVLYKGCELTHWRDECKADNDYFLSQLFMHFVDENGLNKDHAFDKDPSREKVLCNLIKKK